MQGKFFSYLRVSTDKQGERGYGLDAQRKAVTDYLDGGRWELLGEFVEVESGQRKDRPQLLAAIVACKKHKARLVIAKLDRLARSVALISGLMESKIDFVCADMPDANRLTIHILAAVAEHEREMIARRTKEGLAAAKARGVRLGNARQSAANRDTARARAEALRPIMLELGDRSARGIASELNVRGVPAPNGGAWQSTQVIRVQDRLGLRAGAHGSANDGRA